MIRNILVGYDGSESAVYALTVAVGLARVFGSSMHVLSVVRPPEFGGMVETEAVIEQSRQHYQNMLRGVQSKNAACREGLRTGAARRDVSALKQLNQNGAGGLIKRRAPRKAQGCPL